MINFLTNAYKFTLSGEIKIVVNLEESNINYDEISVSIQDTGGIGVSEDIRDTFDGQIKEITDLRHINPIENGIGLIICKIITCRLGKNFGYKSKKKGSNFYFSFYNV